MSNPFDDGNEHAEADETTPLSGKKKVDEVSLWNNPNLNVSVTYLLAMGICGLVLVALGATLDDITDNFGKDSTDVGTVFIARGAGAIFGAIGSSVVFAKFEGNKVICVSLVGVAAVMATLPFCNTEAFLHILFFILGFFTSITDTGCQIMTRKVHGKKAGPWLGANTVAFGISGCIVPLLQIMAHNVIVQCMVYTALVLGVAIRAIAGPNPEQYGRIKPPKNARGGDNTPLHFKVEFVISFMVFCLVGGKVAATAFLEKFVSDTDVVADHNKASLLLVMWLLIAVGRFAGILDQTQVTNRTLPIHLGLLLFLGGISVFFVLAYPHSPSAIWTGIALYGLWNGPCVGYCYDWNNRLTYPTEKSMAIVMFGLNLGASLVPYIVAFAWNHSDMGPYALPYVMMSTMLIPLPFLVISSSLSYDPAITAQLQDGSDRKSLSPL